MWRRAALLAAAAVAVGGCGYSEERTVGVSQHGEDVYLHFALCRGAEVTRVRLENDDAPPWSRTRAVLWEIRSDRGRPLRVVRAGDVPQGFVETAPFRPLTTARRVSVSEYTGTTVMSFLHSELEPTTILRGDYARLTPGNFRSDGLENCRDRFEDTVFGFGLTAPVVLGLFVLGLRKARRARSFPGATNALWLVYVTALALVGAAVVWIAVLVDPHATGGVLPLAILGMLTLGLPVLLLPVPILAVFAWLIRRHPPSPSRSVFRRDGIVRLAVLAAVAVSTSFALALAAELARPWTLEIARVTF